MLLQRTKFFTPTEKRLLSTQNKWYPQFNTTHRKKNSLLTLEADPVTHHIWASASLIHFIWVFDEVKSIWRVKFNLNQPHEPTTVVKLAHILFGEGYIMRLWKPENISFLPKSFCEGLLHFYFLYTGKYIDHYWKDCLGNIEEWYLFCVHVIMLFINNSCWHCTIIPNIKKKHGPNEIQCAKTRKSSQENRLHV